MQPLKTNLCVSLVRQQTVLPMSKTGFTQMKLPNHPISGDAASSAWSTGMENDSSSPESRRLIRAGAFRSDSCLVQGRPPDAHAPNIEIIACAKLAFLPLPGCNELVDGGQLSEVLVHHQHVLDSYRLGIIRRLDAARAKPTVKRRRKADRR
jgi:hypothetical protein